MDSLRIGRVSCLRGVKLVFRRLELFPRRVDVVNGGEVVCGWVLGQYKVK
jgi:hypothetical protein